MSKLARRLAALFATTSTALVVLTIAAPTASASGGRVTWHVKGGELRPGIDRTLCLDHRSTRTTLQLPSLQPCDGSADQKWWISEVKPSSPWDYDNNTHIMTAYPSNGNFMYYSANPTRQPFLVNPDDIGAGDHSYKMYSWKVEYTDYTPFMMLVADRYPYEQCIDFRNGRGSAPFWTTPCQQDNNFVLVSGI